jgi:hypothetical protein
MLKLTLAAVFVASAHAVTVQRPAAALKAEASDVVAHVKKPSATATLSLMAQTGRLSALASRKAAINEKLVQLGAIPPVDAAASKGVRQQQVAAIKAARATKDEAEAAVVQLAHKENQDVTEKVIKHALASSEEVMELASGGSGPTGSGPTYHQPNHLKFTGEKQAQIDRLLEQKELCEMCEAAEMALQKAYNISLKQHKYVEGVTNDVLQQYNAKNAADKAKSELELAKGGFKTAKEAFLTPVTAFTCDEQQGALPTYAPHSPSGAETANITLPAQFTDPSYIGALNSKAQAVRDASAYFVKMNAAWTATITASYLCTPGACDDDDVTSAEKLAVYLDGLVAKNETAKTDACEAIDITMKQAI